ncbi:GmrSD restriction endonuclease domain-containing protein [Pseudonocardia sp. CA-142604]|uniref:GmrSD restriction endonuclease domain-containing protein n=1 Tax=Pseudonocardia sp. CA-142604 TaxID=3240024 RepID=UPI003D8B878B
MQAKEMTLKPILEGEKQYLIPLYQRTYAWKREQLDRLWSDIVAQADALRDGTASPGHFIGSLVLAPAPGTIAGGVNRWLVVDGQQRLTTLLLAFAALRDHIRNESPRDADRVHRQWLVNEYQSGDDHLKLLPTQTDRPAFAACIENTHKPSGGNIAAAYRFFREQLVAVDDPDDPHDIRRIEQAIANRLDLVSITAERDDNVHRIFESLNNTGMSLSLGDLLRNHLFMLLPTRAAKVYQKVWAPMQELLGADNIETLAYLDLVLRGQPELRRGDTYQGQQKRFREIAHDEAAVEAEIVELARRARHLHAILRPASLDEPANREIAQGLSRLAAWGTEAVNPILMVLLDRREGGRSAPGETTSALLYLESYLVRRMLCGRTAAGINRALAQAALAIADAVDAADALRDFLSQPRRYWPDDDQLTESIAQLNFYWTGKGSQRLFVLRRLEESYGHKELVDWDETKVQIEHVLPQTPTPEWLDLLEPDVEPGETPADLHQRIVHRLGNLTLTGYNPDLSNKPFPEKRELLAKSKFSMSCEVAEQPSWGLQQIEARSAALAARAAQVWPGPRSTRVAAPQDQWQLVRRICAALPAGTWTSYGNLSAVAGIHPKPLGNYLATNPVLNAWRVLRADGSISSEFKWTEPGRTETAQDALAAEGVRFDGRGRADASQRLSPGDLATLIGVDIPEEADAGDEHRFWVQLAANQPSASQEAVRQLLDDWRSRGGYFAWGGGAQVSGFPLVRASSGEEYWPWSVKPTSGTVEVVFKHLLNRPPFDDTAVRDEFRQRINRIPGVDIPPSRLELRPSFSLAQLVGDEALKAAIEAHAWFLNQVPQKAE